MPKFGKNSEANLATAHEDLQTLFNIIIGFVDCSVVYGHRTPQQQFELFKKGREYKNQMWEIVGDTVTNCDGYEKHSDHNYQPSKAVDVIPYPEGYADQDKIKYFAGYVIGVADMLYHQGVLGHKIGCGIDWDGDWDLKDQKLFDAVHFFIIN